ncbi:MAG: translation initiation factor IF-2 [Ramalina farinacea]|uniref:Translation initiation factor IF-2 n=1 Tax=Ramalina farinacea TaxID=258253 RepID=A0AA43TRG6_9LECA|nr:translation initiation factor IF-2 [Ramalina farinacea]
MDFELAVWEMTTLLIAPKKVFRSIYHHKQTKNTYHRADPSFTYLLSLFLLLTGLAWGIAYTSSVSATIRLTLLFIFVHFLLASLVIATAAYFLVGKLLGPGGVEALRSVLPGVGRRRRGLFPQADSAEGGQGGVGWRGGDAVEFGVSLFFGNTLYFVALGYYTTVSFLGYNALPFLHHTELLLSPAVVYVVLWLISLFGFNIPRHVGPLLLLGAR